MRKILFPLSLLFGFIVWLRNVLYDVGVFASEKISVPVISIGNITTGGTGKTPHTIYVVQQLLQLQKKVAIISRGYGRGTTGTYVVSNGKEIFGTSEECGDEPLQIAKTFHNAVVIVDEERVRAAKMAVQQFAVDVVVLDDGFQHRKIRRDLDIVIIDSQEKNEMLLPSGNKRELWSSLKRSDVIIFSRWNDFNNNSLFEEKTKQFPGKFFLKTKFTPSRVRNFWTGEEQRVNVLQNTLIVAFCGIGNPSSFQNLLEVCGGIVKKFTIFSDHYSFTKNDCNNLLKDYETIQPQFVITTEKDAERLMSEDKKTSLLELPLHLLTISTEFVEGEQILQKKIEKLFH